MKKFTKTIMLTLTSLCMAICLLFSGCALKYTGAYKYIDGDTTYEIKLSLNDEFEFTKSDASGSSTKNGTWTIKESVADAEEVKDVLVLTIGENTFEVECDGEKLVVEVLEAALLDAGLALDIGFSGSASFIK